MKKVHVNDQSSAPQRGTYRFQSRSTGMAVPSTKAFLTFYLVERVVSCWCFNPALSMADLASMGVRNIILTSGTLSPLPSTASELKMYAIVTIVESAF